MKKILLAAALATAASTATAGTTEQPQMDVTVISQGAATSANMQWLVGLTFLALLIAILAGGSGPSVS